MQMPQISRERALAYLAAVLVLLLVGGRLLLGAGDGAENGAAAAAATGALEAEPAPPRRVWVHVVGAVRQPGLYELEDGSRIDDALRAAGGPKPRAELALVNLAAPVADGQQVVVPVRGAEVAGGGAGVAGAVTSKVRLNTATLEQLDTLPGVGPVTAQKILDYRTAHGAFQSVDELDAVPGIGPARLEQLKELVDL